MVLDVMPHSQHALKIICSSYSVHDWCVVAFLEYPLGGFALLCLLFYTYFHYISRSRTLELLWTRFANIYVHHFD